MQEHLFITNLSAIERKELAERVHLVEASHGNYLSKHEIERLLLFHWQLAKDFNKENRSMNQNQKTPAQERMDYRLQSQKREATRLIGRMTFRDFLHKSLELTEDLVMDGIFRVFDRNNNMSIDDREFVEGLAIILRGNLNDKIDFAFKVYDMKHNSYIDRDEIQQFLRHCIVRMPEEDIEEGVKDIVELIVKKMDVDRDGKINLFDFKTTVTKEPLLLEAFGPCLPDDQVRAKFEDSLFL
jgi:Ca2+-binding EF-hand superfamily protein